MKIVYALALATIVTTTTMAQVVDTTAKMTPAGTTKVWGKVDGIALEGVVEGPGSTGTPLQVPCVFEYTEGDIFNAQALPAKLNGMVHLDNAVHGLITELRKEGKFTGHAYETLLITPPAGTMKAKQLLLIGLGDRKQFNADLMTNVGAVALREALKLKVTSFAFASDLKDAGVESPTALVAENVVKGIINAYRTQEYLKEKHMAVFAPVTKVQLLAGPYFFVTAGGGISQAIASFNN